MNPQKAGQKNAGEGRAKIGAGKTLVKAAQVATSISDVLDYRATHYERGSQQIVVRAKQLLERPHLGHFRHAGLGE